MRDGASLTGRRASAPSAISAIPAQTSTPHAAIPRPAYPSTHGLTASHAPAIIVVIAAGASEVIRTATGAMPIANAMWPATWVTSSFASTEDSDFVLAPHRFELSGSTVRRRRLPADCPEATDPLPTADAIDGAVAWARRQTMTLLADADSETVAIQQEIVEVLAVDGDEIAAEAACVVRITDLPPCLGRFWSAT